jgi:hypothetical protein
MTHGTASTYVNHHCRCDRCTEANSARSIAYRKKRGRNLLGATHGICSTYNLGCRCEPCSKAKADEQYEYYGSVKRAAQMAPYRIPLVERRKLIKAGASHGVSTTYKLGCRCDPCVKWQQHLDRAHLERKARGEAKTFRRWPR